MIGFRTLENRGDGKRFSNRFISNAVSQQAVSLLMDLPHGVFGMSREMENLVETSNNLALIDMTDNSMNILLSLRSSVISRLDLLT